MITWCHPSSQNPEMTGATAPKMTSDKKNASSVIGKYATNYPATVHLTDLPQMIQKPMLRYPALVT